MSYSQKYTIVQFLEPVEDQQTFNMDGWPLHITLADVFAVDLNEYSTNQLVHFLQSLKSIKAEAGKDSVLGEGDSAIKITLIKNNPEIQALHDGLINQLTDMGAAFNSPHFTHEGFLPHCSKHNQSGLVEGQVVNINQLSLVDMFVEGDWTQRKVIHMFNLEK